LNFWGELVRKIEPAFRTGQDQGIHTGGAMPDIEKTTKDIPAQKSKPEKKPKKEKPAKNAKTKKVQAAHSMHGILSSVKDSLMNG
jgi:hypothetical protein